MLLNNPDDDVDGAHGLRSRNNSSLSGNSSSCEKVGTALVAKDKDKGTCQDDWRAKVLQLFQPLLQSLVPASPPSDWFHDSLGRWVQAILMFLLIRDVCGRRLLLPKVSSAVLTLCQVPIVPSMLAFYVFRRFGKAALLSLLVGMRLSCPNRDFQGGYVSKLWTKLPIWKRARSQLSSFKIQGNPALQSEKNVLFCCHPHGTLALGGQLLSTAPEAVERLCGGPVKQDLRIAVSHASFKVPLVQNIARWCGCIPAKAEAIHAAFENNSHVAVFPGVGHEILAAGSDEEKMYVSHKLLASMQAVAGKCGPVAIVPVYVHGESQAFKSKKLCTEGWQDWMVKKFQFIPVWPAGWMGLPVAKPVDYAVVVGSALKLDRETDLAELGDRYMAELRRLFAATSRDAREARVSLVKARSRL